MFESLGQLSSLTWDSAAWIYSVIIGLVLVRYFMFIANLLQEPKAIKFYYPYLSFVLANILHLYAAWYTGKQSYTGIEGDTLQFAARSFYDATLCIAGLIIVPPDKLLEDFFDMKSWFMKVKKSYFFMMVLCYLALQMQAVLGFFNIEDSILTTEQLILVVGVSLVLLLLDVVSAFSKNDYYLSFHGTLMVVSSLMQLSTL